MSVLDSPLDSPAIVRSRLLRTVAEKTAMSVGRPLVSAFRGSMEIDYKVDLHDPVTKHDKQTEEAIRNQLLADVPDSAIVGEEGGEIGDGLVKWYVDPIDGTSNFAAGMAFWCVSIGAVIEGKIVAGAVYDPMAGNLFSADLGAAYLNNDVLVCPISRAENRATLITGYPVQRDFNVDGRERALSNIGELISAYSTLRRPGSAALSLCHVAAGWVDAATGFGVNAWDVTAAILILEKAGGSYQGLTLNKPVNPSPAFFCPGYIALGRDAEHHTLIRVASSIDNYRNSLCTP